MIAGNLNSNLPDSIWLFICPQCAKTQA